MSEQWEQYVEAAADEMQGHQIGEGFYALTVGSGDARAMATAVLAVVGPLIVADTKQRLVEAAARAVERETGAAPLETQYEWQAPCTTIWSWCSSKDHLINQLERLGGRGRMRLVGGWDDFPDIEATP